MKTLVCLLMVLLVTGATAQQQVFRCTINGKTVYGQSACKGGVEVAVDDSRTDAQRQAAAEVQAKEEKRLQGMERDRQLQEKRSAHLQAAGIPYRDAEKAAKSESSYDAKLKKAAKQRAHKPRKAKKSALKKSQG
jgi:hypothetical protein